MPRLNWDLDGFKGLYLDSNVAKTSHRAPETQDRWKDCRLSSDGDLTKTENPPRRGLLSAGDRDLVETLAPCFCQSRPILRIDGPLFLRYHKVANKSTLRIHDINAALRQMRAAVFATVPRLGTFYLYRYVIYRPLEPEISASKIPLTTSHRWPREICRFSLSSICGVGREQGGRSWLLSKVKAHHNLRSNWVGKTYDVILPRRQKPRR